MSASSLNKLHCQASGREFSLGSLQVYDNQRDKLVSGSLIYARRWLHPAGGGTAGSAVDSLKRCPFTVDFSSEGSRRGYARGRHEGGLSAKDEGWYVRGHLCSYFGASKGGESRLE